MSNKEEGLNDMSGFKPAFNNPKVPGEVKGSDQPVIDRDISRDQSGKGMHNARGDPNDDLARDAAGLPAAENKRGAADVDKKKAYEDLIRMGGETPEE